jgi:HNH endonuclease
MSNGKIDREKEGRLPVERLRELLSYDPATGHFVWLVSTSRRVRVGSRAGYRQPDGQRIIRIDTDPYVAHRLAWLYMTGEWPRSLIDHENMDRDDNRWSNLRQATKSLNGANKGPPSNNTSGFKGVVRVKGYYVRERADAWKAEITVNMRHRHIGYFRTPELAAAVYAEAAKRFFGEFARAG